MRIVIFPIMCHLPRGDKKNSLLRSKSRVSSDHAGMKNISAEVSIFCL